MKPEFNKLWDAYPAENHPCDGNWANQCAIRLSIALNDEGALEISSRTYQEPRCAHGHARGAESLANYLWKRIGRPKIYTDAAAAKRALTGKKGIIFFKDCFTRDGETVKRGDHIDMWRLGMSKTYSDPGNQSTQVWFWDLS
jgi:hypothetical protein